jgi:hypothetical protein
MWVAQNFQPIGVPARLEFPFRTIGHMRRHPHDHRFRILDRDQDGSLACSREAAAYRIPLAESPMEQLR